MLMHGKVQKCDVLDPQVKSLQAQANEHRVIKERLQAAVTAALSSDDIGPQQPNKQPSAGQAVVGQVQLPTTSTAVIEAEVADLQHAVSSLQVLNTQLNASIR